MCLRNTGSAGSFASLHTGLQESMSRVLLQPLEHAASGSSVVCSLFFCLNPLIARPVPLESDEDADQEDDPGTNRTSS